MKWRPMLVFYEDFFKFHFSMHEIYLFGTKVGQMMTDLPTLPIFKGRSHTKKKNSNNGDFFCTWSNFFYSGKIWYPSQIIMTHSSTSRHAELPTLQFFCQMGIFWCFFEDFGTSFKVGYTVISLIKT